MAGVVAVAVHHRAGLAADHRRAGAQDRRIEVALQRHAPRHRGTRVGQVDRPIHAQRRAAAVGQRRQLPMGALGKQDHRQFARSGVFFQRSHDPRHVAQRELAERRWTEQASPAVEDHQCLRAGRGLGDQVGGHGLRQRVQQLVGERRLIPAHGLERGEIARAVALDHVAGERPRAAGEADQRHAPVQLAADQSHRVHHVAQFAIHVRHGEFVDVGPAAQRARELRAFALGEAQTQPHRVGNGQDVGEQDRRIEVETLQRLQGHLAGVLRVLRQPHETAGALARGAVLGQVAAGLAHHPDRRGVGGFAAQRAQEAVVLQDIGHGNQR